MSLSRAACKRVLTLGIMLFSRLQLHLYRFSDHVSVSKHTALASLASYFWVHPTGKVTVNKGWDEFRVIGDFKWECVCGSRPLVSSIADMMVSLFAGVAVCWCAWYYSPLSNWSLPRMGKQDWIRVYTPRGVAEAGLWIENQWLNKKKSEDEVFFLFHSCIWLLNIHFIFLTEIIDLKTSVMGIHRISFSFTDWVDVANDLFSKCHLNLRLRKLTECDANVFLALYENILGEKVPGKSKLQTLQTI